MLVPNSRSPSQLHLVGLLRKGAACDAGGPSLGRKRPRRAAVTQGATAPQQYDPALHNAQAKKVSKCCSINERRRPFPEERSTLYQHVRENPEWVQKASGSWVIAALLRENAPFELAKRNDPSLRTRWLLRAAVMDGSAPT